MQAGAYRVAGVSCGGAHSGLVYSDGSAYTFGRGEQGQLGHGVTLSEAIPRKVAYQAPHCISICQAPHSAPAVTSSALPGQHTPIAGYL